MWAASEVGQGSTISFALPVTLASEITSDASSSAVEHPLWEHPWSSTAAPIGRNTERVLVVITQSAPAVGFLSRYLPEYRVLAARDLTQAQTLARQVLPQAIIGDSSCVVLPTDELGATVQAWGLPQVPVICCPLPGEALLRRRLAVDGYLIKPVARQNLWDVLRSFGNTLEQVLIVDDNRDFVRLLRQMLVNPLRPMRVASAYSGEDALSSLRLSPPDLVLLDLGLPDISGAQLVSILRDHHVWRSIPIVVVSAQDELEELEVLTGTLSVTKAGGLLPSDLIRWISTLVGRGSSPMMVSGARGAIANGTPHSENYISPSM
jgi:CheY-like chemotaxis protein